MTSSQTDGWLLNGRWVLAAACVFLGALAALGQAPWGLWWLTLLAFCVVFRILCRATNWQRAAWTGWVFGVGYFAVALFWIVEPFLVDVGRHGWMAPFALMFMAGGFALFWGVAFGLANRVGGASLQVALAIILLSAAELIRGVILTGFPWAMIGHVWADHPILQLAAFVGATGLTLFTLFIAALPVLLRNRIGGLALSIGLVAMGWAYGGLVLGSTNIPETGKIARLVQPNAAQHLKWDPRYVGQFFARQLAMTAEPADEPLDIVIWPETAISTLLNEADVAIAAIADAANETPVMFGANALLEDSYRNSLAVLDTSGRLADTYHKHHLVPFGEYVPFGEMLAIFGIRGMTARDGGGFAAGPGKRFLQIEGVGKVLPLICYELIFPRHLRTAERADLIVQITNDAWFGNLSGPYQHLAQARFRAVEQGLGLVRAANTGVTAAIDPLGRITHQIPLNKTGYADVAIPGALPATLYARTGDVLIVIVLLMLLGAMIVVRWRKPD